MSVWAYYKNALCRSFGETWSWIISQGILATLGLAACSAFAIWIFLRVAHRRRPRADRDAAMTKWWKTSVVEQLVISAIGGSLLLAVCMFLWFFILDGPQQLKQAQDLAGQYRTELDGVGGKPGLRQQYQGLYEEVNGPKGYMAQLKELTDTKHDLQLKLADGARKITSQPMIARSTSNIVAAEPARDPDTIYQRGLAVGKVVAPRVFLNESKVTFDELYDTSDLDRSREFEYRNFILRVVQVQKTIGERSEVSEAGSVVRKAILGGVVCAIVK